MQNVLLVVHPDVGLIRSFVAPVSDDIAVVTAVDVAGAKRVLASRNDIATLVVGGDSASSTGLALLEWLRRERPAIRRILMSDASPDEARFRELCDAVVQQPVEPAALRRALFGPTFFAAGASWRLLLEDSLVRVEWFDPPGAQDLKLELQAEDRLLELGRRHFRLITIWGDARPVLALRSLERWHRGNAAALKRLCVAAAFVTPSPFRSPSQDELAALYGDVPVRAFRTAAAGQSWLHALLGCS